MQSFRESFPFFGVMARDEVLIIDNIRDLMGERFIFALEQNAGGHRCAVQGIALLDILPCILDFFGGTPERRPDRSDTTPYAQNRCVQCLFVVLLGTSVQSVDDRPLADPRFRGDHDTVLSYWGMNDNIVDPSHSS